MTPLLSVVVPIHNMAGRLQNLDQWIAQTIDVDMEVILVDDLQDQTCSTELSNLIKKYPKAKINLLSGLYKSPGESRNVGKIEACGDWVMFWDSDDVGHPCEVIAAIKGTSAGFNTAIFSYEVRFQEDSARNLVKHVSPDWTKLDEIAMNPGVWRFAIKRELLNGVDFPEIKMAEDQIFVGRLSRKHLKIKFIDEIAYSYYRNVSGQLTSNTNAIRDLSVALEISKSELLHTNDSSFLHLIYLRQCMTCIKRGKFPLKVKGLQHIISLIASDNFIFQLRLIAKVLRNEK